MSKVWLVGAGPGDKDLISVKGLSVVKQADIILYDALTDPALLDETKEGCVLVEAGKRSGRHSMKQEEINAALIEASLNYACVVRLKGGDPYIFGRGGEEAIALMEAGVEFEVVPGITSSTAAALKAGIPVTHRGLSRSFHVITGHTGQEVLDYSKYACLDGTLVFLMGLSRIGKICEDLLTGGMDASMPAALISCAYMEDEKVIRATLGTIADAAMAENAKAPAVIVVGETAAMRLCLSEQEVPCPGESVFIVGTERFENHLREALNKQGIRSESLLRLKPEATGEGKKSLASALHEIEKYGWLTFSSQNAVRIFFETANEIGFDRRRLAAVKMAVIGRATAEALKEYGYLSDLMPSVYTGSALAEALCGWYKEREGDYSGTILTIRAETGSGDMYEVLDRVGLPYTKIELYRLRGTNSFSGSASDGFSRQTVVAVGSASGVRLLWETAGFEGVDPGKLPRFACIGGYTAEELRKRGIEPAVVSDTQTSDGLAEAIREYVDRVEMQ